MPMRAELAAPFIARRTVTIGRDLLAVGIFCALGLLLSFVFMTHTEAFDQLAGLSGAYIGG